MVLSNQKRIFVNKIYNRFYFNIQSRIGPATGRSPFEYRKWSNIDLASHLGGRGEADISRLVCEGIEDVTLWGSCQFVMTFQWSTTQTIERISKQESHISAEDQNYGSVSPERPKGVTPRQPPIACACSFNYDITATQPNKHYNNPNSFCENFGWIYFG